MIGSRPSDSRICPTVPADRREFPFRPGDADRLRHRGMAPQEQRLIRFGLQPAREVVDRLQVLGALEGQQPVIEQGEDGGSRFRAQGCQAVPETREGPCRGLCQCEEAQGLSRPCAQAGQEPRDDGRGIELGGKVGRQRAGPGRLALQSTQPDDRLEPGGLIPRQCGPEGQPGIGRLEAGISGAAWRSG